MFNPSNKKPATMTRADYEELAEILRGNQSRDKRQIDFLLATRGQVAANCCASGSGSALDALNKQIDALERALITHAEALRHTTAVIACFDGIEGAEIEMKRVAGLRNESADFAAAIQRTDAAMTVLITELERLIDCAPPGTKLLAGAVNRGWMHIAFAHKYRSRPTAERAVFEMLGQTMSSNQAVPLNEAGLHRTDLDILETRAQTALEAAKSDLLHLTAPTEPDALKMPRMAAVGAGNRIHETDLLEAA